MTNVYTRANALLTINLERERQIERWGWARRLEDRVYGRHLAARIERERSGTFTTANHSHATIDGRREWPR